MSPQLESVACAVVEQQPPAGIAVRAAVRIGLRSDDSPVRLDWRFAVGPEEPPARTSFGSRRLRRHTEPARQREGSAGLTDPQKNPWTIGKQLRR